MKGRIKRNEGEVAESKLPLLGSIKVGEKSEKGYPTSLDYFIATGKYKKFFDDAFGEKPNSIQIVFISDNEQEVCNERYECRDKAGKLIAKGDGDKYYVYDTVAEEYVETQDKDAIKGLGKWSAILTLRFIIPKINSVFGHWQFSTKGEKSSIPSIRDTFDMVKETAGTARNIPFDLVVEKVKSQKPGQARSFPVVTLIPNVSQSNLETLASYIQAGNSIKTLGMLTGEKLSELKPKEIGE